MKKQEQKEIKIIEQRSVISAIYRVNRDIICF